MTLDEIIIQIKDKLNEKTKDFGNKYLTPKKVYEEIGYGIGDLLTLDIKENTGLLFGALAPGFIGFSFGYFSGGLHDMPTGIALGIATYTYLPFSIGCIGGGIGIDLLKKIHKLENISQTDKN